MKKGLELYHFFMYSLGQIPPPSLLVRGRPFVFLGMGVEDFSETKFVCKRNGRAIVFLPCILGDKFVLFFALVM